MYRIYATNKAQKGLEKLAKKDAKKVSQEILKLKDPFKKGLDVKKIAGHKGFFRLRIKRVRVLFEVDKKKKEVWIRKIGYRPGFYRFVKLFS